MFYKSLQSDGNTDWLLDVASNNLSAREFFLWHHLVYNFYKFVHKQFWILVKSLEYLKVTFALENHYDHSTHGGI